MHLQIIDICSYTKTHLKKLRINIRIRLKTTY